MARARAQSVAARGGTWRQGVAARAARVPAAGTLRGLLPILPLPESNRKGDRKRIVHERDTRKHRISTLAVVGEIWLIHRPPHGSIVVYNCKKKQGGMMLTCCGRPRIKTMCSVQCLWKDDKDKSVFVENMTRPSSRWPFYTRAGQPSVGIPQVNFYFNWPSELSLNCSPDFHLRQEDYIRLEVFWYNQ